MENWIVTQTYYGELNCDSDLLWRIKAKLYVNFIVERKYNFSIPFFFVLCPNLCCNDSEYYSLNWKDFSVTNLRISYWASNFSLAFFRSYIVYRVSFIFPLNAFLVSLCTKGFAYFALLTAGKGNRTGM